MVVNGEMPQKPVTHSFAPFEILARRKLLLISQETEDYESIPVSTELRHQRITFRLSRGIEAKFRCEMELRKRIS